MRQYMRQYMRHRLSPFTNQMFVCAGTQPLSLVRRYPANVLSGFEPTAGAGATYFHLNDLQVRDLCEMVGLACRYGICASARAPECTPSPYPFTPQDQYVPGQRCLPDTPRSLMHPLPSTSPPPRMSTGMHPAASSPQTSTMHRRCCRYRTLRSWRVSRRTSRPANRMPLGVREGGRCRGALQQG